MVEASTSHSVASKTLWAAIHPAMSSMKLGSSPPERTFPAIDKGALLSESPGPSPHSGIVMGLPCSPANVASQFKP